jgi:hypothetical protein
MRIQVLGGANGGLIGGIVDDMKDKKLPRYPSGDIGHCNFGFCR